MSATCPVCDAPQDQGLLCHADTTRLERDLGDVAAIVAELDTTISKQARIGNASGPGGLARERSPINMGAMQVADDLQNTLTTWARDVAPGWQPKQDRVVVARAKAHPLVGPFHDRCQHRSCELMRVVLVDPAPPLMQQVSLLLLGHIDVIRRHPAVNELVDEITDAIAQARRVVDRPADRQYLGKCMVETPDPEGRMVTCLEEVWARQGASFTACKVCGITHDVVERQRALLKDSRDLLLTVREAAQVIGSFGDRLITESTIRGYISKGKIGYHGKVAGSFVIRVGDLLEVITENAAKPKGRKLRNAS